MWTYIPDRRAVVVVSTMAACGWAIGAAGAAELFDNLERVSAGTETVTADRWLAASFKTDAPATYSLSSVTLLLGNTSLGAAALDLYSDGVLEPGTLVAALTSPASYSAAPAATTFSADGVTLDAGATYWLVLRALSGAFEWAWTADNTGGGAGFDTAWDVSEDGGAAWYTHDVYPLQLAVTVADGGESALFRRGDCNEDGDVDISDAVCTLNWLFLGAAAPGCVAVTNSNGDGSADISDATYLLNHLFLGGPPPVVPYPECGPGALQSDAELGCGTPPPSCS
jgi:hypothetical protein